MSKHLTALQVRALLKQQNPDHKVFIKIGQKSYAAGWANGFDMGKSVSLDVEPDVRFAPPVDGMIETLDHELSKSQGKRPLWVTHNDKNYKVIGLAKWTNRAIIQTEEG